MTQATGSGGQTARGGGEQQLRRGFSLKSAIAMAFADISPIVALFAIFSLGLFAAGPAFFWAFPIVLIGQMLVACVFGELASRWPYAGSVYQWARHVRGTTWGWAAAWAYIWGLTIALSSLSYGAAGFLLEILGVDSAGRLVTTLTAFGIIAFGTISNMIGRTVLKVMFTLAIGAEIIGSVGLGFVLLFFYRENSFGTLFDGLGSASTDGLWLAGPGLIALAYVGWSFLGFEAAGSIAEEVEDPERNVPKAIIWSLLGVAIIVMFSSFALLMAIPNIDEVVANASGDPVADTLTAQLGAGIAKPFLILIVIGFIASFLAVQAAVSRCIWGSARDGGLPASTILAKLSGKEGMPSNSIAITGIVAALLALLAGSDLYGMLVNSATIGFYIAFGIPVFGAALSRWNGTWEQGQFNLGKWGAPVTYMAAVWIALQSLNIIWPRTIEGQSWYLNWSMIIITGVLGSAGVLVYRSVRSNIKEPIGVRLEAQRLAAEEAE